MKSIILVLLLGVTSLRANAADPYEFRGARLGVPLSEFKQMSFPDTGGEVIALHGSIPILSCSDMENAKKAVFLILSAADRKAGVVKCQWVAPRPSGVFFDKAWIDVGRAKSRDVIYSFIKTPESAEPLLFNIAVGMKSVVFQSTLSALNEKFGAPTESKISEVKNKLGNTFGNNISTWDNGISEIKIEERYLAVDEMRLNYRLKTMSDYYLKEVEKNKEPAKL